MTYVTFSNKKPLDGLDYIPISPAYPQKENRLILKGWGVELRVLGWIFWGFHLKYLLVIARFVANMLPEG